ncbi:unnamed protein product [Mytilus coruscus]|uniref:Uncharacterized protein n=1 Tax=Mytilus coruscus TaxID=42192 RepID=A0A6J8CB34_MYTCO|nr:unnamed protein product [Mytilus coruscus]
MSVASGTKGKQDGEQGNTEAQNGMLLSDRRQLGRHTPGESKTKPRGPPGVDLQSYKEPSGPMEKQIGRPFLPNFPGWLRVNAVNQGGSEDITPPHTDTLLEEISQQRDTDQGQRILQEKVSVGESFILNPFQTAGHMPEGIDMISKIPLGELHIEKQIPGTEEGDPINNTSRVLSCSKRETPLNQLELSETIQSCVGIIEQSETPVHGQKGGTAVFKAGVVKNQGPNPFSERGSASDLLVSTMSGLEWEAPFSMFEALKEDECSKMKFGEGALGLMPAGTAEMLREVGNWTERVEQVEAEEAQMNGEQSQQWDSGIAFLEHNQHLITVHPLLENNGVCGILDNPQKEGKGVIQKEGIEGILPAQPVQFEYDFQL